MPTKDPVKNQEYVAKSRSKLRASIGDEAYKKQEAEARKLRRHKAKACSEGVGFLAAVGEARVAGWQRCGRFVTKGTESHEELTTAEGARAFRVALEVVDRK